jgi:hypothetical protein
VEVEELAVARDATTSLVRADGVIKGLECCNQDPEFRLFDRRVVILMIGRQGHGLQAVRHAQVHPRGDNATGGSGTIRMRSS